MKAERIFQYGSPDVIEDSDVSLPEPGDGEVRVRVKAAGVGPWDALIRSGKSAIPQTLPVTLGSDIAGVVDAVGKNVSTFRAGDEVYGVTNPQFVGGYAEYAIALVGMIAIKPKALTFIEAASVPVVAVTAWQMLFDYAHVSAGQRVLIQGGAGNVGGYAIQLAKNAGLSVIATASARDNDYVRSLGADTIVDFQRVHFEEVVPPVDVVLDTVGGETRERSFRVLKPGGLLVSVASPPFPNESGSRDGKKAVFFYVDVTTARLNAITELFDPEKLKTQVGTVLPLQEVRKAHQMLAGTPHARGKIVLSVAP